MVTFMTPIKAAVKLSQTAKNCLCLVGAGVVYKFDQSGFFGVDDKWKERTGIGKTPTITATCKSLIDKGLVEKTSGPHSKARLTPEGQRIFDQIATQKVLETRDEVLRSIEWLEKQNSERARYRDWLDANHDVMQSLRERINQRAYDINVLKAKVTEIGFKIGSGANNVDELLAELRTTVRAHEALKAEQDKDVNDQTKYNRPIPF